MSPDDIPEVLILTGFPVRMRLSFAVLILRNTPDLASERLAMLRDNASRRALVRLSSPDCGEEGVHRLYTGHG